MSIQSNSLSTMFSYLIQKEFYPLTNGYSNIWRKHFTPTLSITICQPIEPESCGKSREIWLD